MTPSFAGVTLRNALNVVLLDLARRPRPDVAPDPGIDAIVAVHPFDSSRQASGIFPSFLFGERGVQLQHRAGENARGSAPCRPIEAWPPTTGGILLRHYVFLIANREIRSPPALARWHDARRPRR